MCHVTDKFCEAISTIKHLTNITGWQKMDIFI